MNMTQNTEAAQLIEDIETINSVKTNILPEVVEVLCGYGLLISSSQKNK